MIELLLQAERALAVGLLDRAETLYRLVAKADPRNSIAIVGLARVTLDRGDDVEALALARRALEIDPENDAAIRLAARLEEVLDYRFDAAAALGLDEPAPEAGPESTAEAGPEPEAEPDTESLAGAESAPETVSPPDAQPEAETESQLEPEPDLEPEPEKESEPEPWPTPEPSPGIPDEPAIEPGMDIGPSDPVSLTMAPRSGSPTPSPAQRRSLLDRLFRRG